MDDNVLSIIRSLEKDWIERAETRAFEPECEILHCVDDLCERFGVKRIFTKERKAEAK